MDDTFRELQAFKIALNQFNFHLSESVKDMEEKHKNVDSHWKDEMRKTYDSLWRPLHKFMEIYINQAGPRYEKFLDQKIQSLGRFLHGN